MCTVVHRVPNFRPFRSTISHHDFRDNIHTLGFPIDSHVKISKCHKTWPIAKKSDSLYSTILVVANVFIKFGSHQMKTVGGEAF